MARTLADVIFQDRILFTVPLVELFPPRASNSDTYDEWKGTYKYDKDGIAYSEIGTYRGKQSGTITINANILCEHPKGKITPVAVSNLSAWDTNLSDPVIISTRVVENELWYELSVTQGNPKRFMKTDYDTLKKYFPFVIKEPEEPEEPELPEEPEIDIIPPPDFKDEPPQIWGHTTEDIEDITGYANTPIPIIFRAWDDIGIARFYYCLINESETEGTDLIRPINPMKYGDFTYKFNILKSTEGSYQYKIIAFDTSNQRTDSNIFNVIVEPPITHPSSAPVPPSVSDSEYIILYDKKTKDFTSNGIGILDNDTIECIVENEENGIYELSLKYLITGKYVDELLDTENIIKCKTDISNNEAQLFRIYDTEYIMEENIVIVKANHISYDLKDSFVESINLVDVTCKQATQTLMSRAVGNDKFVVDSNVETIANFKHERISALEAIMGIEKSIFDTYGSSKLVISRNNFNYSINKQVDNDKGIIIAYSKNLLGFKRSINTNDIITGIYPYAYSRTGACIKLKEKVLWSENASEYATYKIKPVDFTSDSINDEESLKKACENYFSNGCNLPKISYDVDFILLYSSNYALRSQFRSLEEVVLGDTVTIQDSKIGINVKARIIKTVYNVLKKRYEKIQLGNFKNEYRISRKNEINNLKKVIRNAI